jgi:hypothetical protein
MTSTAMAAGLGGRIMVLAALYAYRSVSTIGGTWASYELAIFNAAWLLVLAQPTATLSLDCRIRRGSWVSEATVSAWPRYLLIFQLVVIYSYSGLHKVSPSWNFLGGYTALYYILQDPTWASMDNGWMAHIYPLIQLAGAVTWHFEMAAPLLLLVFWYRDTAERPGRLRALFNRRDLRRYWVLLGVSLHLGILVFMEVGPFSLISMAYYICLWGPDELSAAARYVRVRWERLWVRKKTAPA